MCDMTGFNVCFGENDSAWIEPHFCRTPDCGGGMSLDDACTMIADHYHDLFLQWQARTHYQIEWYRDERDEF